jgi:A/G-specific adenine glycosylase
LAFGLRRPAGLLDTNTRRIVSRVKKNEKAYSWTVRLDLYELAGPAGPDAAFNYSLLDLGALVCRASTPLCDPYPVRDLCGFGTASRAKSA